MTIPRPLSGMLLLAAACTATAAEPADPAAVHAPPNAANVVTVTAPYVFELPPIQKNSAMYLTLANRGATEHALVAAATPAARVAELHTHLNDDGVMRMRPVARIPIPAGGTAALAPGGDHIMMFGLAGALRTGDEVKMHLEFEDGSTTTVVAKVKKRGGSDAGHAHHHHDHHDHAGHGQEAAKRSQP